MNINKWFGSILNKSAESLPSESGIILSQSPSVEESKEILQNNLPLENSHIEIVQKDKSAFSGGYEGGYGYTNTGYVPIFTTVFNGEKNKGELGSPRNLLMDYRAIRARAYEAYGKSDVVRIVTGKIFKWVIGSGLKMQAQPDMDILGFEKITLDQKPFIKNTEAYFALWAESPRSDYNGMGNLHINAEKNLETKFLGGDALTVCRFDENYNLSVQIIDGQHVQNPISGTFVTDAKIRGNMIIQGVEINPAGKHIAFYVQKQIDNIAVIGQWERIEAYGKESGCLMAWMGYADKHRIDHHRGVSRLSTILEKVTKLDRFTEAAVSSAEERAKIYLQIVHDQHSDGESPFVADVKRRIGFEPPANMPFAAAVEIQKNIQSTENKMAYNMPIGSKLEAINSNSEITYDPFFMAIFLQISASQDMPPEVALQKYSSNYSASRAAINMFQYIIDILRKTESRDFYQRVFNLWFYAHVLKNKVQAPGYLEGKNSGNMDVVEAYTTAKFTGVNMPHIDPLKEANAIRVMLGIGDQSPLITHEDAAEQLGNGDWSANILKNKDEKETLNANGFKDEVNPLPPETPKDNATNI